MIFDLDDWASTEDCADCEEAWILTRGEAYEEANEDDACESEGWSGLEGTTFGVGYDDAGLMVDLGDGWQSWEEGDGEIKDEVMFFELQLIPRGAQ